MIAQPIKNHTLTEDFPNDEIVYTNFVKVDMAPDDLGFDENGLLPSIVFNSNGTVAALSPYQITAKKFAKLFCFNERRITQIEAFCTWQKYLETNGVIILGHWISGSFIEDIAAPNDIDVLTFFQPIEIPETRNHQKEIFDQLAPILDKGPAMRVWGVDPKFVCGCDRLDRIVHRASRWTNLYSFSRRMSPARRGFVSISGKETDKIQDFNTKAKDL